jgi:hypothetical protein
LSVYFTQWLVSAYEVIGDYSSDQKSEMVWACGTVGEEGSWVRGLDGETREKETTWMTWV